MEKMRMESMDGTAENIVRIGELFPNCVTEKVDAQGRLKRAINFELLKQMLSNEVLAGDEAYEFTWVGKKAAIVEANKPIRKTLRPCKEESVAWDTTENLYIEGDNLEVLKLLQESYLGKVKMIYIDPPYNTGHDFVYPDSFIMNNEDYNEGTGYFDEDGNVNFKRENSVTEGKYHSDWCSMIYSRLMLARNLLSDDGVIFISIDDNEQENLKKCCDEVFGEKNFSAQFIWTKTATPPSLSHKCRKTVEYVLCYEKQLDNTRYFGSLLEGGDVPLLNTGNPVKELCFPKGSVRFNFIQNGVVNKGNYEKSVLIDDIIVSESINQNEFKMKGEFKWGQSMLNSEVENGTYFVIKTDKLSIRFQRPFDENNFKTPNNLLNLELNKETGIGTNETAVKELELLNISKFFDFPKPLSLVKYIINMVSKFDKEAIIMDFFFGSATTAHAVMQLNAEDGGHRKFIMVQLPEPCDAKSEAYKAGYKNICEIGKERIRRAGAKIKADSPLTTQNLDTGFRVLKLDDSNMKDVYYSASEYTQGMLSGLESNIKEDRDDLDLLFGCLLEWGLPLSLPYSSEQIEGCTVHNYNDGDLIACFDENIPESVIKVIAKKRPLRAVFRDSGFASSPDKINVGELFKLLAPDTRVKVI